MPFWKRFNTKSEVGPVGFEAATSFPSVELIPFRPTRPKKVVFFVTFAELWRNISSVWESFTHDPMFECLIVLVPGRNRDENSPSFKEICDFFDELGLSYLIESAYEPISHRPHFAFYTSPYHSMYSKKTRPVQLAKNGVRVCYIPYACEVGGGLTNLHSQYKSEVVNVAWRIFARNSSQAFLFETMQPGASARVVKTGHPRAEHHFFTGIKNEHPSSEKAKGRPVILWNPHFAISGKRPWSTFIVKCDQVRELIDKTPDIFFIIRPHPLLIEALSNHKEWGLEKANAWFEALARRENVSIDLEKDHSKAFNLSSGLISDTSSLIAEYLLTEKPICHLQDANSVGLSHELSQAVFCYPGSSKEDLRVFIAGIKLNEDTLLGNRKAARNAYFGTQRDAPSLEITRNLRSAKSSEGFGVPPMDSNDHSSSLEYWKKAKTTFLAPPAYYTKKESALRGILRKYSEGKHAVDVGCGDGRFTFLIADSFDSVVAIDPSPTLVAKAIQAATLQSYENVDFHIDTLETTSTLSTYDLVSVMGVTSGFLDDLEFTRNTLRIKSLLKPGGILILTDTLSLKEDQIIDWKGYHAVYRNLSKYLNNWKNAGFSLFETIELAEDLVAMRKTFLYVFGLRP